MLIARKQILVLLALAVSWWLRDFMIYEYAKAHDKVVATTGLTCLTYITETMDSYGYTLCHTRFYTDNPTNPRPGDACSNRASVVPPNTLITCLFCLGGRRNAI
jgi:hypothetical protein